MPTLAFDLLDLWPNSGPSGALAQNAFDALWGFICANDVWVQNAFDVLWGLICANGVFVQNLNGVFWGFIEGFLFWFLDDIGASKLQMGWTVTIGRL